MGYQGNYPPSTPLNPTQLGTGVVTTDAIANGAVIPADLSTGGPYWNTSGNVGIGTTSPSQRLHVRQDQDGTTAALVQNRNGTGSPVSALQFITGTYDLSDNRYAMISSDGGSSTTLKFWTGAGVTPTERMRIDSSGNVGIGTSSPSGKLHVSGGRSYFTANSEQYGIALKYNAATTGVWLGSPGTDSFTVSTEAGTERMRIDSSGNVGIGTTSPTVKLQVVGGVGSTGGSVTATGAAITMYYDVANDYGVTSSLSNGVAWKSYVIRSGGMIFKTSNDTEAMRLDTSGNLLVGGTTRASVEKVNITHDGNSQEGLIIVNTTGVSNTQTAVGFRRPSGTTVGTITTTTSTTAYNTSSDYRLKNSVAPLASGLSTISALKPVSYKWNVDDSVGEGFIAHELAQHIPLAVAGEKDAVDDEGNIKPQGVDYSKIVVHLVAAMQEQQAQITLLKAELDALKGTK